MIKHNFIKKEIRPNTILEVKVDVSFRKIKKNAICFHIWRIEDDRLEAEPKEKYGTFYDDGAYIIYAACPAGSYVNQDTITREAKYPNLERYIHFWLGAHVNEEKRSNVTHKIQELDSYFGNIAAEYRETQNNESSRFMSYFKKGIFVLSHALVAASDDRRLYQVRGHKYLHITEMPKISWEYFAADYVMLLKLDSELFIWFGRSSSKMERREAMEWASTKLGFNNADTIILDDGYEQSMPENFKIKWNSLLPLNKRIVAQGIELPEVSYIHFKGFKCGYKAGRLYLDQLDVSMLTKDDLKDSTAVYVLDAMPMGIWMWVGNQAAQDDCLSAMGNGRAYVKKKKYPYTTPVMRVVEGHEPLEFERLFAKLNHDWNDSLTVCKPVPNIIGKINSITLCQRPKMAANMQLIDDGTGERILYCITADYVLELPRKKIVTFETDKCYVMEYSVMLPTTSPLDAESVGVTSIIYQWNGSEAKRDAVKKCNNFSKTCFEKFVDRVMYVQMHEYEETAHFLQIFDGKLILLQSHSLSVNSVEKSPYLMLKICGDASYNSKAIEISPTTGLNSKECYVVKSHYVWVWCGQSSTGDLREVAKGFGNLFGEYSLVLENKEPLEFWNALNSNDKHSPTITSSLSSSSLSSNSNGYNNHFKENGKRSPNHYYSSSQTTKLYTPPAQLFLVWSQRGKIHVQEIFNFDQVDLVPESVFILDTHTSCFVWLGQNAPSYEKQHFMELANFYLNSVCATRRSALAISVIRQGAEPNIFKGLFNNWNNRYWNNFVGYEEKRQNAGFNIDNVNLTGKSSSSGDSGSSPIPLSKSGCNQDFDAHQKYPIITLQKERDLLPVDVDPLNRELHLTHDDFVLLFNMSFWEFEELPKWKKQELKKKHKLF